MPASRKYVVTRTQELEVFAADPEAAIEMADTIWDAKEDSAFLVQKIRTTDLAARESYS